MRTNRKCALSVLLAVFLFLSLLLPGCASEASVEESSIRKVDFDIPEPITLRVMVDGSLGLEDYLPIIAEKFHAIYDNVTIEVEYLSEDVFWKIVEERRKTKLQQQMELIEAGVGPDIFILQGNNQYEDHFFPDVNIAMRNGYFADLNEYYMTDAELKREELCEEVMEAGVVDGARYLLPLTYGYSMVTVDMERLYEVGLDSSIFESGMTGLLQAVNRIGDPRAGDGLRFAKFYLSAFFPDLLNYDTGEVLLSKEELTEFLVAFQEYIALYADAKVTSGDLDYYYWGEHWHQHGLCMEFSKIGGAMEEAASAKILGYEPEMFPITRAGGKLVAEIEVYCAVSANCQYPEVAYEFLRMLLLPETMMDYSVIMSTPVRMLNHVDERFESIYEYAINMIDRSHAEEGIGDPEREERLEALKGIEVTEEDLPILQTPIDVARILPRELKVELSNVVAQLNDPETGQPTDVDIEKLAQGYIDYLTVYLNGQLGKE